MKKEGKEKIVKWIQKELIDKSIVVLVRKSGISANDTAAFRHDLWKDRVGCKVIKNSLLEIALKEGRLKSLVDHAYGPTALLYADDFPVLTKKITEFSKDRDLEIVAGVMNDQILTVENINQLASLPSLDELRSRFIALIQTPATRIACVIKEPATKIARILNLKE